MKIKYIFLYIGTSILILLISLFANYIGYFNETGITSSLLAFIIVTYVVLLILASEKDLPNSIFTLNIGLGIIPAATICGLNIIWGIPSISNSILLVLEFFGINISLLLCYKVRRHKSMFKTHESILRILAVIIVIPLLGNLLQRNIKFLGAWSNLICILLIIGLYSIIIYQKKIAWSEMTKEE